MSQESSIEEANKITGPPQVQDSAILNVGQGHVLSPVGITGVSQAAVIQGASLVQPTAAFSQGPAAACPQHPHHHHHHGPHQHQHMSPGQMAMPVNAMATQSNSVLSQQQQPTVIFAAAPPGHHMSIPVMAGFPPAPTMQVHSAVPPSMLAMHHGHQTLPPPLGHTQAIHIHHHPGQSLTPPHLQGPNVQGFPPSVPPPQAPPISSNTVHVRGPIHQQEFNDPAIMSVSKLPPPRPGLQQQSLHVNSLPTNIMQMNPRQIETSHQHGRKPSIPANSNVKSVQDLEREMMGGSAVSRANNNTTQQAQTNKTQQQNRLQGQLQHRGAYNNNVTRQMQTGFRNHPPNQVHGKIITK